MTASNVHKLLTKLGPISCQSGLLIIRDTLYLVGTKQFEKVRKENPELLDNVGADEGYHYYSSPETLHDALDELVNRDIAKMEEEMDDGG